ncbi:MAG: trypsin-like peptidase domain-containing protein [Cyanobacteria bacterium P01_F01_bin.143]
MTQQKSLIPVTCLSFVVGLLVLSSPSPVATQAKKFTVQINGENSGSGTIIKQNKDNYTVLTSWHVVKYPGNYSITTFDNKKHPITQIKNLPDVDLALVEFSGKSKSKKPYPAAELGDSKNITSGLPIYISGYLNDPGGKKPKRNYLLQPSHTLSLQSLAEEGYRIVHDHALIPGTSGGPIVDRQARIVGVNGTRTKEAKSSLGIGIGIPIQIYQAGQCDFVAVSTHKSKKPKKVEQPKKAEKPVSDPCLKEKDSTVTSADAQTEKFKSKYDQVYASPAGHFGDVNAIAMQGDIVVTGSEDATVKVWNRASGKLQNTLIGHGAPVTAVAITDKIIVTGSQDATIRLWDLETGEEKTVLDDHGASVDAIATSKDGTILVSGSGDDTVKVWDLNTTKLLKTFKGHKAPVYSVAISDNKQTIVSGSEDKSIKLWNLSSDKPIKTFIDEPLSRQLTRQAIKKQAKSKKGNKKKAPNIQVSHNASIDSLSISQKDGDDKEFIISGGSDNLIKIWNLETGELTRTLKGHNSSVRDLAVADDILVSADSNYETVKVWNFKTGSLKRTFTSDHYFWFSSIAISEDGSTLVSASQDEAIKVINLEDGRFQKVPDPITGEKEHPLIANNHSIRTVTISDNHIFNASRNNTITVRNLETGELEYFLKGHTDEVNSLAVRGKKLVSGSDDRTIRIWNLETWELERTIRNVLDPIVRSIAISEDGQKIVTGSYKAIKIWDLPTGKLEKFLDSHKDGVNAITIQGDTIVSGGGDKTIEVRSLTTGELSYTLPLEQDKEQGHKGSINSVIINDGKIYSASYDKTIKVWDLETGKLEETLTDHDAAVNSLAISENTLVSGSRDGAIETRNLATGQLEDIIKAHPTSVNTVAISGDTIVSGSSDNTIKIWRVAGENSLPTNLEAKNTSSEQNN